MTLLRRAFLRLAAGAAFPLAWRTASAQGYPAHAVRIIVPSAPGGPNDVLTRLICQWLSEHLGQPFVIENRPGAGTNVATEALVRAPADGYTLFSAGPASAINATLYEKLSFNFIRDSAPVAAVMRVPNVVVVLGRQGGMIRRMIRTRNPARDGTTGAKNRQWPRGSVT